MNYNLISLQMLPFTLSLFVCAIILSVALYGHLNFKHVAIKNISVIMAVIASPIAIFYIPLLIKIVFEYRVPLVSVHVMFSVLTYLCLLLFCIVMPKHIPSPIQLAGVILFGFGGYLFFF